MKLVTVSVGLLLVLSACSSNGEQILDASTTTTTTTPPKPTTTTTPEASTTSGPSTTATTTTTEPSTSTTPAPGGEARFALAQVVFGDAAHVKIRNVGNGPGSTAGFWLCRFPDYWPLPDVELMTGEVLVVAFGEELPPRGVAVAEIVEADGALGRLNRPSGEVALYSESAFDNPEAISDYVEWGNSGHPRAEVASAAGIWQEGTFVAVDTETLGLLAGPNPSAGAANWTAELGG